MEIRSVSLKDYSSLKVGGMGDVVEVENNQALIEALEYAKKKQLRAHILGQGTNSYFGNDLSQFLFIKLQFKGIKSTEEGGFIFMTVQASEVWDDVVKQSVRQKLWGIENLSLIPGTVGAAPVQNIGAYGVELKDIFESLLALNTETMEVVEFRNEDCKFGYRDSIFKHEKDKHIIVSITLKLQTSPHPVLTYKPLDLLVSSAITSEDVRNVVVRTRTTKLPDWQEHPNAGSFFKNPIVSKEVSQTMKNLYPEVPLIEVSEGYKIPTAWLIEHVAEMKGVRRGDLGTWPSQPLVLVNYGEASADNVDAFAKEIKEKVQEKTGILLEQEVNRVG